MKNLIGVVIISFFIASCSGGKANDKQAELDSLIEAQSKINDQIRALKEELKAENKDNSGIRLVATGKVAPASFTHYVDIQATVEGEESVNVSARSQGIVTSILVKEGDNVSKGQVLATLDDQIIRQSQAEVETQYSFAKNIYDKQKNLWDQKIGSEVQYLTAKNNKESLEKRLALMNEQLDLTRIKSPVNGTVDNIDIKIGQALMPGLPVMSVVNLSKLKVKGEVGESYAGKIKKGDEVILFFPDQKKEVKARVGYSSKMINALNRTFNVEVPLSSAEPGISPNMVVVMKIADYKTDSSLVVPVDMLQRSSEGYYVMTAVNEGGKMVAKRKPVVTGYTYNGQAEVLSGLTQEDVLITTGYRDLNDGQEIRTK
jgi:membrane fusion protein, multidrug efflux system